MSRRFAAVGPSSGETLSYGGLVLTHDSRDEMEFLLTGCRVVEIGDQIPPHDTMSIKQHPDLSQIRWPLRREDFS